MSKIEIFNNEEFGSVRTININGIPYFVGKDIATILAYTNPQKAIRDHVDDDDKTVNELFTVNGTKGILINESGLYSLILSSKLPNAKKFKKWVTSEVLPSIRKTGGYNLQVNNKLLALGKILEATSDLEKTLALKEYTELIEKPLLEKIEKQQPKVDLANLRIDKNGCYSITDVTKTFNLKKGQITNYAKYKGLLHKNIIEVNKAGEKYFKIYMIDGIHKQIGILDDGLQWIKDNLEQIKEITQSRKVK